MSRLNVDALFFETFLDLHAKLDDNATEYQLLRASALMRQLLVDGNPLVHQVRRRRQQPIVYRWAEFDVAAMRASPLAPSTIALGMAVPEVMFIRHRAGSEQEFLAAPVAVHQGEVVTARDVIKLGANVDGGVHAGKLRPDELGQARLDTVRDRLVHASSALGPEVRIAPRDLPGGTQTLKGVGRVIVRALKPLYVEIAAERQQPGATT